MTALLAFISSILIFERSFRSSSSMVSSIASIGLLGSSVAVASLCKLVGYAKKLALPMVLVISFLGDTLGLVSEIGSSLPVFAFKAAFAFIS